MGPDWGREVATVIVHDGTLNRSGAVQCSIVHIGGGYGPGVSSEWRELRFAWDVSARSYVVSITRRRVELAGKLRDLSKPALTYSGCPTDAGAGLNGG